MRFQGLVFALWQIPAPFNTDESYVFDPLISFLQKSALKRPNTGRQRVWSCDTLFGARLPNH